MLFIKRQRCAGSLALLLCTVMYPPAQAADAPSQNLSQLLSGNTLGVDNRFTPSLIYFYADGRCRHIGPNELVVECVWRVAEESVCLTVTSLPPGRVAQEHCLALQERSFGVTWTEEDPRNGTITYRLLAGHPAFEPIRLK